MDKYTYYKFFRLQKVLIKGKFEIENPKFD